MWALPVCQAWCSELHQFPTTVAGGDASSSHFAPESPEAQAVKSAAGSRQGCQDRSFLWDQSISPEKNLLTSSDCKEKRERAIVQLALVQHEDFFLKSFFNSWYITPTFYNKWYLHASSLSRVSPHQSINSPVISIPFYRPQTEAASAQLRPSTHPGIPSLKNSCWNFFMDYFLSCSLCPNGYFSKASGGGGDKQIGGRGDKHI